VQIQDVVIRWLASAMFAALGSVKDPASPPHLTVGEEFLDLGVVLHDSVERFQGLSAASLASHV
jgi:hypothetical protein